MNTQVMTFESQEFGKVRTVEISGEPWMVGKDIAKALGYKETANMRKLLDAYDYKEIDPQSSEFTRFVQNGSTLEPKDALVWGNLSYVMESVCRRVPTKKG